MKRDAHRPTQTDVLPHHLNAALLQPVSLVCGFSQSCRLAGPSSWCGSLAAELVELVFTRLGLSQRCRIRGPLLHSILLGRSCRVTADSLTGYNSSSGCNTTTPPTHPPPRTHTHMFFHIFILGTSGLKHCDSETETVLINLAKLQPNLFITPPLSCSSSAFIYPQEAGSDCCKAVCQDWRRGHRRCQRAFEN